MRSAATLARPSAAAEPGDRSSLWALGGLLLLALVVRLAFINAEGFRNDVVTFEAWALALGAHPTRDFFSQTRFADYPPGYFFVLYAIGHIHETFFKVDPSYSIIKLMVKLPGVVMDLVDACLIFAIVRRFASPAWALGSAALFALNPATIYISAYWGQVDSVGGGLTLASVLLIVDAATAPATRRRQISIVLAWLAIGASILIKPPAVMLVPLMLAFVFVTDDPAERLARFKATGYGVLGALFLAYLSTLPFHAGWNPFEQFAWLYSRYAYASWVYPYTSVNAFNLYAIRDNFWMSDTEKLLWFPRYGWGIGLLVVATGLIVSRYLSTREPLAFLEAAMIVSLAYFILSTRMHERYVFNALMLATPLVFLRGRYLYATIALSVTLLANLMYSFEYLRVMSEHVANANSVNLNPWLSRPMALLNVATFFYVAYTYLGGVGTEVADRFDLRAAIARLWAQGRTWFAPLEGVSRMTRPDWIIGSAMAFGSFLIMFSGYALPNEKIFDEIYYARAGEEYLSGKDIFEYTHPPLTKLLITASMTLFGGLHGAGDTATGWRFLNVVVGALMVLIVYCFAKRLLGSTLFAGIAAGLLAFDGFHFVQSRIATPEITVAFFSIFTLYAFYRFWLASRVRVAPWLGTKLQPLLRAEGWALAAATLVSAGASAFFGKSDGLATHVVVFLYFELGLYAAVRIFAPRFRAAHTLVSYADGSRVLEGRLETFDGGIVPLGKGGAVAGLATRGDKNALTYSDDELRIEYGRGTAKYITPEGTAAFEPAGTMTSGGETIDGRRDGVIWMVALAVIAGCLAASKWNGLFDYFVVWALTGVVVLQSVWPRFVSAGYKAVGEAFKGAARPAVWGNPFGISLDILVAGMLFVGATIYLAAYIPYLTLPVTVDGKIVHHSLADLIALQKAMYGYHCCEKTVMISAGAHHPYASSWWQWPLLDKPISYYYHDFRTGVATQQAEGCCVAEIIALPNPIVWWLGLVSVPMLAWLAWKERNKGYAILFTAYMFQWLPWIGTPRLAFEYHFFPNLAIICLADAVLLKRVWDYARDNSEVVWPKVAVGVYLLSVVAAFVFWYPILAGTHITWQAWDSRMMHWLFGNSWV